MDFTTRRVAYVPLLPQEKAFTPQASSEAIFLNFIPFAKHKRVRATRHCAGFRWTKEPHQEVQPHGYKFGNTGCRRPQGVTAQRSSEANPLHFILGGNGAMIRALSFQTEALCYRIISPLPLEQRFFGSFLAAVGKKRTQHTAEEKK